MFSSRVIKIDESEDISVRTFLLRQFQEGAGDDGNGSSEKKPHGRKGRAKKEEAEKIVARAQQEAARIKEQAVIAARKVEQEAFQKGVVHGKKAGREAVEKEWSVLLASMKKADSEFERIKKEYYASHYDSLMDLVFSIVRKVIRQEITINDSVVTGVVRSAIENAIDREKLKVRLNPDDLDACKNQRDDFLRHLDGIKELVFEPDPTIERGGAVVEYTFGEIDARLDQQLLEVERELRKVSC